jgi:aspartate/methionine/tyrosine aminotransferase
MFGELFICYMYFVVAVTARYCVMWTRADKTPRSIVNEAAQASPVQPIVNMGQGFFGYNPPQFVLDAAHDALGKVECNQYSPTKV